MRIGVDFDNTIVCYDGVFYRTALDQGLIPASVSPTKGAVRDYLRAVDREDEWTALQGHVYGARMQDAAAFPGVQAFFAQMLQSGHALFIISHKTRHPYLGPKHDLHQAARSWLEDSGFCDCAVGLPREQVFFELTKDEKLRRIASLRCTHFIDDLPEFLGEPGFPSGVQRLLFDPGDVHDERSGFDRFRSWDHITDQLGAS